MAPPPVPLRHYADASVITTHQVTEDTPPDLLQGSMKLKVALPSGKQITFNVHRSTPMMDVLVQVTSAHKINPGNHAIRIVCNNQNIQYKPSTAVGSLDISAIEIVSKTNNEEVSNKDDKQAKDKRVRLKEWVYKQQLVVNLPRNQLAVYRLPPKTLIAEVLSMVCEDKNFEEEDFEIRHPVNLDERLRGSCSLSDYQLQEVCVVSKNYRAPPLSVNDLFAMSSLSHHHEDRKRRGFRAFFSRKNKQTIGNSSLSSGSTGDRSESPENETTKIQSSRLSLNVAEGVKYRTGDQKMFRPTSLINLNKIQRKRPAPLPPQRSAMNGSFVNGSPVATSCHNLSVDDGQRNLTPLSSEFEDEKNPSRSESRNMNSPVGGPTVPSRMKRKAPLPPPATVHSEEIVSSQDKTSITSPSPDLDISIDNEVRSRSPSEVSIDVRPSSSNASDAIPEEDDTQVSADNIRSRINSLGSNGSSAGENKILNAVAEGQSSDSSKLNGATVEEFADSIMPETHKGTPEPLIKNSLETASIDEETSSQPLETLDEILEKAEADLNERDISSPYELAPNGEISYLKPHVKESNEGDELSLNEEGSSLSFSEETHELLETVQEEPVAEALNEMWSDVDKVSPLLFKDILQNCVKFKDNEVERSRQEKSELQTLVFNFVEKNPDRILKNNNDINGVHSENSRDKVITELSQSRSPSGDSEGILDTISTSNYNVILKMKPQPKPRTDMGRNSPSSDSVSSYHSIRTDSESKSRSNTDASYESVPPPLPSEPIPESSELDDNRSIYSIVSSSSSNDANNSQQEDYTHSISRHGDAKPKMFSISTYANRDQKRSYRKRITRSESLQEISRPLEIDKIENRTASLQRNQRMNSEPLKENDWTASSEGSNSLERSYKYRNYAKDVFERTPKISEESGSQCKGAAEETGKKPIKPSVPIRVSKWYQEFNKEYIGSRNVSNLRKTKSIADIRMNDGQPPPGVPDPGLAQEYLKLQNDFMKWQNQLMQNQNVLHNKVAPIAAPNLVMGQASQTPYTAEPEPHKRRELNIPIRMEGDDSFVNQTSSFSTTGTNETVNNLGNQSEGMWNNPPNAAMGSWKDAPAEVERVYVTDPPQVFQAPNDPRFKPIFIREDMNPPDFGPGFIPVEPVFRGSQVEPMNIDVRSQFNSSPNRPQFAEGISQYVPQHRYTEAPVKNTFQPTLSRDSDTNNQNVGNRMPQISNTLQQKTPFNAGRSERDDSGGKFTSIVTLSNDQESNRSPKRGSPQFNNVETTANSVGTEAGSYASKMQPTWGGNSNNGANNRSNTWNKPTSPEKTSVNSMAAKDSFTPMSSRLVQAATTQPTAYDSRANAPSNLDTGQTSQYTPYSPAAVYQYPPTYDDNSIIQPPPPIFDTKLIAQQPTTFASRQSPKPQTSDSWSVPKPQTFPPMPKFEPPPSFEPAQEPMRISPPRRQKKSPSPVKQVVPPRRNHSQESRPSPIRDQLSDSFAIMKPFSAAPGAEQFPLQASVVPPPPAPSSDVPPPPPPPPPRMKPEIRRTSTGKKIISSNVAPELDAREELMMAIRNFGGSNNLRKQDDY